MIFFNYMMFAKCHLLFMIRHSQLERIIRIEDCILPSAD